MKSFVLKVFFILLFIVANLYFAIKVESIKTAKNEFSTEEISKAVDVLSEKGVHINPDTVLREKSVSKVLKMDFDLLSIENVAKKIMKSEYGTFTVPDGQRFASDTETFSFFNDYTFEYRNLLCEEDFEDRAMSVLKTSQNLDRKDSKEYEKFFEELFESEGVSLKTKNLIKSEPFVYFTATECINGKEIETTDLLAVFKSDKLVFAKGKVFFSDIVSTYDSNALDGINILFKIDNNPLEISKMEMVYFPVADKNNSFYLTPNYKFCYYDGSTYIYDATSGIKK